MPKNVKGSKKYIISSIYGSLAKELNFKNATDHIVYIHFFGIQYHR